MIGNERMVKKSKKKRRAFGGKERVLLAPLLGLISRKQKGGGEGKKREARERLRTGGGSNFDPDE